MQIVREIIFYITFDTDTSIEYIIMGISHSLPICFLSYFQTNQNGLLIE